MITGSAHVPERQAPSRLQSLVPEKMANDPDHAEVPRWRHLHPNLNLYVTWVRSFDAKKHAGRFGLEAGVRVYPERTPMNRMKDSNGHPVFIISERTADDFYDETFDAYKFNDPIPPLMEACSGGDAFSFLLAQIPKQRVVGDKTTMDGATALLNRSRIDSNREFDSREAAHAIRQRAEWAFPTHRPRQGPRKEPIETDGSPKTPAKHPRLAQLIREYEEHEKKYERKRVEKAGNPASGDSITRNERNQT